MKNAREQAIGPQTMRVTNQLKRSKTLPLALMDKDSKIMPTVAIGIEEEAKENKAQVRDVLEQLAYGPDHLAAVSEHHSQAPDEEKKRPLRPKLILDISQDEEQKDNLGD